MLVKFQLDRLPPTLNEQIDHARRNKFASAKVKRQWTGDVEVEARRQLPGVYFDKVWLAYEWFVPRFSYDEDNVAAAAKFVMDGLVRAGVLKDDNLTVIQNPVFRSYRRGEGRLTLWLSDSPDFLRSRYIDTLPNSEDSDIESFVVIWSELYPQIDLVEDEECSGIFYCPKAKTAIAAISLDSKVARSRLHYYATQQVPVFPALSRDEIIGAGEFLNESLVSFARKR